LATKSAAPSFKLRTRSTCPCRALQMTIGAPGEEAALVGAGVRARRSGEPSQIGSDSSVELLSGRPGVSDEWGDFMLDHDPIVRSPEAAANIA